jgi:hypothetical protein
MWANRVPGFSLKAPGHSGHLVAGLEARELHDAGMRRLDLDDLVRGSLDVVQ